jgi:hypothetical protein
MATKPEIEKRQHWSSEDGMGPCWCRPKLVVPGNSPEYRELSRIVGEAAGQVSMCWEPRPEAAVFLSNEATKAVDAALAEILAKFTITTKPEVESYE